MSMESIGIGGGSAFTAPPNRPFMALKRLARPAAAVERCELCSIELAPEHEHLLEPSSRRLVCSCTACSLLFDGQTGAKLRRVPRRVRFLSNFRLTDSQWDGLFIPINMAFFFHSTPAGKIVALYPSPGGATESTLALDTWGEIAESNPILNAMEPDVETLLVRRLSRGDGSGSPEYYLAPIDECYKLVGLLRANWHGLSGGSEVWQVVESFFRQLREKAESDA
jgi:hypothetical protein